MSESRFALFGATPTTALMPTSIAEAQDAVRQAMGAGNRALGWGRTTAFGVCAEALRRGFVYPILNQIVDYQPADMTITAQAGVTISQLQDLLATNGQFLPIDIAMPDRQTVGGVIATRADSLRRMQFGSVRDALLGVTVINSLGEAIKGGGKVVKNVSGYDLPKLYCGSMGTLGLIAEATFKVAPIPRASATVLLPLDADHNSEDVLDHLLGSDLSPSLLTLVNPSAAAELLPHRFLGTASDAQYLVIGFDGVPEAVAWQIEALGAPDGVLSSEEAASVRSHLRDYSLAQSQMTATHHILSSQVGAFVRMLEWTARRAGFQARVIADAALGIVWAHYDPKTPEADWGVFYKDLADKALRVGGSFIIDRMPEDLRNADVPVWSPILLDWALMGRLKKSLDPQGMWNPGRFIGGL